MQNWKEYYNSRIITMDEAAKMIKSGDSVCIETMTAGLSSEFANKILDRWEELEDVKWNDGGAFRPNKLQNPDFARKILGHIEHQSGFAGPSYRKMFEEKLSSFFPKQAVDSGAKNAISADVFMCMVTTPDEHGYMNIALSNMSGTETLRAGKDNGKRRVAICEVNDQVPWVYGASTMHVSEWDYFVVNSTPLIARASVPPTEDEKTMGQYVAEIIKDGDCFQLGMGGVAEAAGALLYGKHDIGIHSEMVGNAARELVEAGVVTNRKKTVHQGITVATFVMGDKATYEWANRNPSVEIHPGGYVTSPFTVAKINNMVAVNQALLIDFSGNITAESIGYRQVSGSGWQLNFHMGAYHAPGGRSITLLNSARKKPDGTLVSSIVPGLPEGTSVTVPRTYADYVITEYGVAHLKYKNARDRAEALIAIAHPELRSELRDRAKALFYPN